MKENVGLGNVDKMGYRPAIDAAVHLAEAGNLVASLPDGLKTQLESPGFESISYPGYICGHAQRHGLSGGEVSSRQSTCLIILQTSCFSSGSESLSPVPS